LPRCADNTALVRDVAKLCRQIPAG
jgi:hypothetical protein